MAPSLIVTSTELGAALTRSGRLATSSATVNVSLSVSASSAVVIVPDPVVEPAPMPMLSSAPKSPGSAVPLDNVIGMIRVEKCSVDGNPHAIEAVTVTALPSATGFGEADNDTVGLISSAIVTVCDAVTVSPPTVALASSTIVSPSSSTLSSTAIRTTDPVGLPVSPAGTVTVFVERVKSSVSVAVPLTLSVTGVPPSGAGSDTTTNTFFDWPSTITSG